jgi:hypothetical protein
MILGMSIAAYTAIHVAISLVGIGSGLVVIFGFLTVKRFERTTAIFLAATALTSISGFGFPFHHLLPSHIVGILSLVILGVAIPALYLFHLAGAWRWSFVVSCALALWLNCFVLIVQLFEKIPILKALAPTQKEPPFATAQLVTLLLFVALTIFAVVRFHPERIRTFWTRDR